MRPKTGRVIWVFHMEYKWTRVTQGMLTQVKSESTSLFTYNKSFLNKLGRLWLDIGLVLFVASLWTWIPSRSINIRRTKTQRAS